MNKIFSLSSRIFLALVMISSQFLSGMMHFNPLGVQEVFAGMNTDCCSQDILFVVDRTGSMTNNNKRTTLKTEINRLMNEITYPTRYALIDFNTSVTNTIPWTWSKSAINSRLNAIQPIGQTNYASALQAGKEMMDSNTSNCKIAIVIGDGGHNTSDIVTAGLIKDSPHETISIALEGGDIGLLTSMATSTAHFYEAPNSTNISTIVTRIIDEHLLRDASTRPVSCGDGNICGSGTPAGEYDPPKECDNGAGNSNTCTPAAPGLPVVPDGLEYPNTGITSSCNYCSTSCNGGTNTKTSSYCGDNKQQSYTGLVQGIETRLIEECDGGVGCTSNCKVIAACGDGMVNQLSEECDQGTSGGTLCRADCKWRTCGDGNKDLSLGEQCDYGSGLNNSTHTIDGQACNNNCQIAPICGNNHFEQGEQCESITKCNARGYYPIGYPNPVITINPNQTSTTSLPSVYNDKVCVVQTSNSTHLIPGKPIDNSNRSLGFTCPTSACLGIHSVTGIPSGAYWSNTAGGYPGYIYINANQASCPTTTYQKRFTDITELTYAWGEATYLGYNNGLNANISIANGAQAGVTSTRIISPLSCGVPTGVCEGNGEMCTINEDCSKRCSDNANQVCTIHGDCASELCIPRNCYGGGQASPTRKYRNNVSDANQSFENYHIFSCPNNPEIGFFPGRSGTGTFNFQITDLGGSNLLQNLAMSINNCPGMQVNALDLVPGYKIGSYAGNDLTIASNLSSCNNNGFNFRFGSESISVCGYSFWNPNTFQGLCMGGSKDRKVCKRTLNQSGHDHPDCDGLGYCALSQIDANTAQAYSAPNCSNCQLIATPNCGNGTIDSGEQCDGESNCTSYCTLHTCGDNIVGPNEVCDGTSECTNQCTPAACGDSIVSPNGTDGITGTSDDEECDTGTGNNIYCTQDCKIRELIWGNSACGNGAVEFGEACDNGSNNDGTTMINGIICNDQCERMPVCGDRNIDDQIGETCDDGNNTSGDGCSNSCRSEICGDGVSINQVNCTPVFSDTFDGSGAPSGSLWSGSLSFIQTGGLLTIANTSSSQLLYSTQLSANVEYVYTSRVRKSSHNPPNSTISMGFCNNSSRRYTIDMTNDNTRNTLDGGSIGTATGTILLNTDYDVRITVRPNSSNGVRYEYKQANSSIWTQIRQSSSTPTSFDLRPCISSAKSDVQREYIKVCNPVAEQCDNGTDNQGNNLNDGFTSINGVVCNQDCTRAKCGDGILNLPTEQCDLGSGNSNVGSNCNLSCRHVQICGNGIVQGSEDCDLGTENGQPGSLCNNLCRDIILTYEDGACGDANGKNYEHDASDYGTDIQCEGGIPSTTIFPEPGGTTTWSCNGILGGTTETGCTASRNPVALCGNANGKTYAHDSIAYDTDTQCLSGTSSNTNFPIQGGTENRSCTFPNGGSSISCSAERELPPVCGTANQTYANGTTNYGTDTFCNPGSSTPLTPAFPSAGQIIEWECSMPQGGEPVTCQSSQGHPLPICNIPPHDTDYYQRRTLTTIPYSGDLCSVGTVSNLMYSGGALGVDEYGQWTWNCSTVLGDISCIAHHNYCGNGILEGTEQCDDGNAYNTDECTTRCRSSAFGAEEFCGDGIVQQPNVAGEIELCDEGINNGLSGSLCGIDCLPQEEGIDGLCSAAITSGSFYTPEAPDQSLLCDQGLGTEFEFATGTDGISGTWSWNCTASGTGTDASCSKNNLYCGDGSINGPESCDDGNTMNYDGCNSICEPEFCEVNGVVYVDTDNDDLYDPTDIELANIVVTLTADSGNIPLETGGYSSTPLTIQTDSNGYYSFQGIGCLENYTLTYNNTTPYHEDSAQHEQSVQQLATENEIVENSFFTGNIYVSDNNNFGLVQYDLSISKVLNATYYLSGTNEVLFSEQDMINGFEYRVVESGDIVYYVLSFTNTGPTVATGVIVRDFFDPTKLQVDTNYGTNGIECIIMPTGATAPNIITDNTVGSLSISITTNSENHSGVMQSNDTYSCIVKTLVSGKNNDVVRNNANVYTVQGTGDAIEDKYSEDDDFANNVDYTDIGVKTCMIDGFVYLDIDDDDTLDGGDTLLDGVTVRLDTGETFTTGAPYNTNGDTQVGYYRFDNLSCRSTYTVSYTNNTSYLQNSSQDQFGSTGSTQGLTETSILVTPSDFRDSYKLDRISEDNNFGLIGYDLSIQKSVTGWHNILGSIDQYVRSGNIVTYTLSFENEGPTRAYPIIVRDEFNSSELSIQEIRWDTIQAISGTTLSTGDGFIEITLPDLDPSEGYSFEVDMIITDARDELVRNTANIYTPNGTGENNEEVNQSERFENNEDSEVLRVESTCAIDGYLYIDVTNSQTYLPSATPASDLPFPINGIQIMVYEADGTTPAKDIYGNLVTASTNKDSYYYVEYLDCKANYVIGYDNSKGFIADHHQFEQNTRSDTDESTRHTIEVSSSDFDECFSDIPVSLNNPIFTDGTIRPIYADDQNQCISPNNNFGIVQYDLSIEKAFVKNVDAVGVEWSLMHSGLNAIEHGDTVTYTLVGKNAGPAPALSVSIKDYYDPTQLTITDIRLKSSTVAASVNTADVVIDTSTPGVININLPSLMFANDEYAFEVDAVINGVHNEVVNNRATIYTPTGTNDIIEENYSVGGDTDGDGIDEDFDNNEDEIDIVIVGCAVNGVVYVDVDGSKTYNVGDIILNEIPVTVNQNTSNITTSETIQTANGGIYMVDELSCRHPVTISYTHDTEYTSDSAQLHQDMQQSDIMTIQIPSLQLDGNENITPIYQDHFISEDNNFGLLGYGLEISKSFVSNTSNLDNVSYPKTTTIDGVSYPVIEAGDTVVYALTFANMDTTVATGVHVRDIMPNNMEYLSHSVVAGNAGNLTITHDDTTNILDIVVGDMPAGTSYTVYVTTRATNATTTQYEMVTNRSTIYTNLATGDAIEDNYDPDQFINNESDVTIAIEYCTTNGALYLDIADNDTIDSTDPRIANQQVSFDNGFETFEMLSAQDGTYAFSRHSCRYPANISYVNSSVYLPDSAQFENTTNDTVTPLTIDIPVTTYSASDKSSLENNFGLVGYDLWIDKSSDRNSITHDGMVNYTITFGNHGPTVARNAIVSDILDEISTFNFIPSTLDLGVLSGLVTITWSGNSFSISDIPMLEDGDSYSITIQGKSAGFNPNDLQITNRTNIFVGNPETDIFERDIFENNRDEVSVAIAKYYPPIGGAPDPVPSVDSLPEVTPDLIPEITSVSHIGSIPEPIKRPIFTTQTFELTDYDSDHMSAGVGSLPSILPKTGSKEWNMMLALVMVIILGGGVYYLKRRKAL